MKAICSGAVAAAALAAAGFADANAGGAEGAAQERAQSAIEACWSLSDADRASGVTAEMRRGAAVSAACLEGVLQDEMQGLLAQDSYRELDLPSQIESLRDAYQSIYWQLYNGGRRDGEWRGTMYQMFHLSAYADLLERMIRDVARERDGSAL